MTSGRRAQKFHTDDVSLPRSGKCIRLVEANRAFSHDVTAAILVFQNKETAAMLVFQTSPMGVELFSYVKNSFVPINLH